MTLIRFALSAASPGKELGQAQDYWWTSATTYEQWLTTTWTADGNGTAIAGDHPLGNVSGQNTGDTMDLAGVETSGILATTKFTSMSFAGVALPVVAPAVSVSAYVNWRGSEQDIRMTGTWNTVKDIEVMQMSTHTLKVSGFVDTWISSTGDTQDYYVEVDGAKRGSIDLGSGSGLVELNYLSNEYDGWSNHFHIAAGDGSDAIYVRPETYAMLARLKTPAGWTFNTAPDRTTVDITLGKGNDPVFVDECSATITAGTGNYAINLTDGHNTVVLGSGTSTTTVRAHAPGEFGGADPWPVTTDRATDIIKLGTGEANVAIDDEMTFMTPLTTIEVTHGHTGTYSDPSTMIGADWISYSHLNGSSLIKNDWSALTLDLIGYTAGSTATLQYDPYFTALLIQDAAGGPADVLKLQGGPLTSISDLHLHFA